MDPVNRRIVDMLSADARTPFLQIAQKVGVSEGTVRNRVAKMIRTGVIRKFTLDWGEMGGVEAVVGLKTDTRKKTVGVASAVKASSPRIRQVMEVSGGFDLVVILDAITMNELNGLIEKLRAISGVVETQTFVVLNRA